MAPRRHCTGRGYLRTPSLSLLNLGHHPPQSPRGLFSLFLIRSQQLWVLCYPPANLHVRVAGPCLPVSWATGLAPFLLVLLRLLCCLGPSRHPPRLWIQLASCHALLWFFCLWKSTDRTVRTAEPALQSAPLSWSLLIQLCLLSWRQWLVFGHPNRSLQLRPRAAPAPSHQGLSLRHMTDCIISPLSPLCPRSVDHPLPGSSLSTDFGSWQMVTGCGSIQERAVLHTDSSLPFSFPDELPNSCL